MVKSRWKVWLDEPRFHSNARKLKDNSFYNMSNHSLIYSLFFHYPLMHLTISLFANHPLNPSMHFVL